MQWIYRVSPRQYSFAAAALVVLLLGWSVTRRPPAAPGGRQAQTARVERGALTINVVESGTIRPRQQIVLRNETDRDTTIVTLAPEGSMVKKGDVVVELDATFFEDELTERRIRVLNAEAAMVRAQENFGVVTNQAQADVDQTRLLCKFAQLDLKKYLEGEYPKLVKELEAKITLAEEEQSRAEEELRWSQTLFEEKYLALSDLQQDQLAAKKAGLNVQLALEERAVTTNFTHHRRQEELQSNVKQADMALQRAIGKSAANIAQAKADLRAAEAEHEEEKAKVHRIQSQITKAQIRAPIDGMVLYASSISDRSSDTMGRIQQGATVDKKGEIIYLPTAESFDVDIQVPEVNLAKIRAGLPVKVTLDALPGQNLSGKVKSIATLPDSKSRWLNPNLKFYNTVIALDSAETTLRNGMSCKVEIVIKEITDALYVPIQSVVQQDGQPLVYLVERASARPVPVGLGMDNNRVVHIVSGLEAGQSVLLAPPLSPESRATRAASAQTKPAPASASPAESASEPAPTVASAEKKARGKQKQPKQGVQ